MLNFWSTTYTNTVLLVRAGFWAPLFISMYFAFTSAQHGVTAQFSDVVLHAFAFVYLTVALCLSHYREAPIYYPSAWMLAYAIFIECVQYFLPGRVFEFGDIGVDVVGIFVGLLIYRIAIAKVFAVFMERGAEK